MNTIPRISIIGDGGWGTTLAAILASKGFDVALWGAFPENIEQMKSAGENVKFLPGVKIPRSIQLTSAISDALRGRDLVVLAAPSQFMRGVLTMLRMEDLSGKTFISVAKGIENGTLQRMSEVAAEVIGRHPLAVLSGPTIALEVANGVPTTAVIASDDEMLAARMQDLFMTDRFRLYTNSDVIGVEIGGSIKNVIAIAAGATDALGFGTNAKAALLTRGLVEIARLGVAMGARRETFYGLSGLGDLTTTCISQYSRNRWLGEEIGNGKRFKDALKGTEMVVEGVATAKSAHDLSLKFKVEMPIVTEIFRVLYENKDPKTAVHELMTRSPRSERDY